MVALITEVPYTLVDTLLVSFQITGPRRGIFTLIARVADTLVFCLFVLPQCRGVIGGIVADITIMLHAVHVFSLLVFPQTTKVRCDIFTQVTWVGPTLFRVLFLSLLKRPGFS